MKKNYCYEYPRPALTVDMILLSWIDKKLSVLLIQRKYEPFVNRWAFPGGFVEENETAEQAAERELEEETGLKHISFTQLHTTSELNRDPRYRTVSIVYYGFFKKIDQRIIAGDDASAATWFDINQLPSLAFDHDQLVRIAIERLISQIKFHVFGKEILSDIFGIDELTDLYLQLIHDSGLVKKYITRLQNKEIIISNGADLWQINNTAYLNVLRYGFIENY